MFKKIFSNVKSTMGNLLDEVNDEEDLESCSCYLTIADTSLECFNVNEEIIIHFTEDEVSFDSTDDDGYTYAVPYNCIQESCFKSTTIHSKPFKGSYILIDDEDGLQYFYFKPSIMEPHYFLECLQKYSIAEDINNKRYARTAVPIKSICTGCGAVIHEANCLHCGFTNAFESDIICESSYEYLLEPEYRAVLELHSTSLNNLYGGEKVFYHIYQDCISIRIRGTEGDYIPQNVVLLFEHIQSFSLKQYGSNTDEIGLYITFNDGAPQYLQFKSYASNPKDPKLRLEYARANFNLQDVFDAVTNEAQESLFICEYCGLAVSTSPCPHCGGVR